MSRGFATDGLLGGTSIDYYRRRAAGGVGLIITEGIAVSGIGALAATIPRLDIDGAVATWQAVTAAVHDQGGRIMAQLWHAGLGRIRDRAVDPEQASVGPLADYLAQGSPLEAIGGTYPTGRPMSEADIAAAIDAFASAAVGARAAGFDGVELHAAHGYLIDQFFWSQSNRRTDGYGVTLAGRLRFAIEIVRAIRLRCGPDFPIGLRFSQWKLPEHYAEKAWADPGELEAFLGPLVDAGVTFFDASTRRFWEAEFAGNPRTLAEWTKHITGRPTMMVGSIGLAGPLDVTHSIARIAPTADLRRVEEMIATGAVDLVGVGRALIANPDWADRVRIGDVASLRAFEEAALATLW